MWSNIIFVNGMAKILETPQSYLTYNATTPKIVNVISLKHYKVEFMAEMLYWTVQVYLMRCTLISICGLMSRGEESSTKLT